MNFTFLAHGVGQGKTKTALDMAVKAGCKRIIVFVPSVLKTMKHWEREAIKWDIKIPMEVYTYYELQKYGRSSADHRLLNSGKGVAVIYDECLLGNSVIKTSKGDKRLKNIKVGDKVLSYNHSKNISEYKSVTRLIKRPADDKMYCISYRYGSIISTYNHPFLTQSGYKMAKDIIEGDLLYELREHPKQNKKVWRISSLPLLSKKISRTRVDCEAGPKLVNKKISFLQQYLFSKKPSPKNINAYEKKQPHVQKRYIDQNDTNKNAEGYVAYTRVAGKTRIKGWKWQNIKYSVPTIQEVRQSEQGLDYGITNQDKRIKSAKKISRLLQSRHWKPLLQNSYRMRWSFTQFTKLKKQRQEEGREIKPARVARIEVFKQNNSN